MILWHRIKLFAFYLLVSACASVPDKELLPSFMRSFRHFTQVQKVCSQSLHRNTKFNSKPNDDFKLPLFCHLLVTSKFVHDKTIYKKQTLYLDPIYIIYIMRHSKSLILTILYLS